MGKYKLVAFDMDGTLVTQESSWWALHRHFGVEEKARENLLAYERGEIDYREFMRRDIKLWQPPPHISEVKRILARAKLAPGVKGLVEELRRRGYKLAIVTGGLDVLAELVAQRLGIKHLVANGLEVDEKGYLTGEGIFRVEPSLKHEALAELARSLGLTLEECVAVGDSKYDVNFLKHAGFGVAVGNDKTLREVADLVIQDFNFSELLNYL